MTTVETDRWVRTSERNPCPICGHGGWCSIGRYVVHCMRVDNGVPAKGDAGGWLHKPPGGSATTPSLPPPPQRRRKSSTDWGKLSERFRNDLPPEKANDLSLSLGIPVKSLLLIGLGWDGRAYSFPMYDSTGNVCGVRARTVDGEKRAWLNSSLGVIRPVTPGDGVLLVCEGESDTAAAISLGFDAIGTPGAGQCSDILATYCKNRDVVVVADADDAGMRGAGKLAQRLARCTKRVSIASPPAPHKDLRAWFNAGATPDDLSNVIDASAPVDPIANQPPESEDENEHGGPRLGSRDESTGRIVLSITRTIPTALAYIREKYSHDDGRTLHCHQGKLLEWRDNRYVEVEDGEVLREMTKWLHEAITTKTGPRGPVATPFPANHGTALSAIATLRAVTHLSSTVQSPSWLGNPEGKLPIRELLPCKSTTLHLPTGKSFAPSPSLFTRCALDFDFNPQASQPTRWMRFLDELWGDDLESIRLLQEWFGYCLTPDTSHQKMLLLQGPRRCGKGTIARVLIDLVGDGNHVGPTVGSLGGDFGLQPLIGKSLAVVSDARFNGERMGVVVERLLVISGEDPISIDRKHMDSVTVRLPTRFMFLSNELPKHSDAGGALARRFLVLQLERSWLGREDKDLRDKLRAEMPGILLWAIDGWKRLQSNARFGDPESSRAAAQDIEDMASPVGAFLRDKCNVGPEYRVTVEELYSAWRLYCDQDGRSATAKPVFSRDLQAAAPNVKTRQGTGGKRSFHGVDLRR